MNEGKSQTWFYYASQVLEEFDIDYAGKMDTDSLPYLDKYFSFADESLPPAPYNQRILAGSIANKGWWNISINSHTSTREQRKKEKHFVQRYGNGNLHLYAEGQMYILSRDLAKGIGDVAREVPKTYVEGHEDHDVSAMAFLSLKGGMDHPMKLLIIAHDQKWWRHGVKLKMGSKRWREVWQNEILRLKSILAEQKGASK